MNDMISYDDFAKLDIRIGKILEAEKVEGTDKLLKLKVDIGEEERQVIAGISKSYEPEDLIGKESIFLVNLEPRKIRGLESQAMIMIAVDVDNMTLVSPVEEIEPGVMVR